MAEPENGSLAANELAATRKQLHSREQAYHHLVDNVGSIIIQFDLSGRPTLCNRCAEEELGYSEEALLAGDVINLRTVFPDLDWDDRPGAEVLSELAAEDHPYYRTESFIRRRNGQSCWLSWVNRILLNDADEPLAVLSVGNDVTARKRYEAERSKKLLQLQEQAELMDLAHDCIIFRDLDGTIRFWNRGARAAFGWSAADTMGKNIHRLLSTQFPKPQEQIIEQLLSTGVWEGELRYTNIDGNQVVLDSRWSVSRDPDGEPSGILELGRNITRQKEFEQALRVSEERCRMALISSAEGVWDCDIARGEMYVSAIGRSLLGISRDVGYRSVRWWLQHIYRPERRRFWHEVRNHLKNHTRQFSIDVTMETRAGALRPVQLSGMAFAEAGTKYRFIGTLRQIADDLPKEEADATYDAIISRTDDDDKEPRSPAQELELVGKYITHMVTDVSEREDTVLHEEEQLRAREKLVTVGRLAASVAHEIRNPMTAIRMRLHTLGGQVAGLPEAREDVDVIAEEIVHLEQIVKEFLDFSRPREPKLRAMSTTAVLKDIMLLMNRQFLNHGVDVFLPPQNQDARVLADRDQLKQVFVNVMKNAMDAMPEGGELRISLEARDDARVVVHFADSGAGIPDEFRDKIFTPFFSAKEGGTGLGLSTCARLLAPHNGQIELERTGEDGTVFAVILPMPTQC